MRSKPFFIGFITLISLAIALPVTGSLSLRKVYRDIADHRFEEAENKLTEIARNSEGERKQEALFMLAGLKQSASEAELIYQEVINIRPKSEWGQKASLEIAKIRYAIGDYDETLRIIKDSYACDVSDEACLFYGLSAIMLKRYEDAKRPLSRIKRGKLRTWAYLSLAEIEMAQNNWEEACNKYRAMANTLINPTALYRHAECLEKSGETELAKKEFHEVIKNFRNTPEGILAAEKLQIMEESVSSGPTGVTPIETAPKSPPFSPGYTIQFGSFHDRYNAIKLAAKLKQRFPNIRIDSDLVGWREVHRVRLGYFRTREEAQLKADEISREIDDEHIIMNLP